MRTKVTRTNRWRRDLLGYGFWLLVILSGPVLAVTYYYYYWFSTGAWTLRIVLTLALLWILLWIWAGLTFGTFWPWNRAR
jgi:hypothetical protein